MVRPLGPHSVSSIVSLPVLALIVCSFACSPLFRSCPSNFFRVCARSSVHAVSCVCFMCFSLLFLFLRFLLFFFLFVCSPARSVRGGGRDEVPRVTTPGDRGGRVSRQHAALVGKRRADQSSCCSSVSMLLVIPP